MTIPSFFKKILSKNKLLFLALILTSAFASLDGVISPYIIGKITNTLSQRKFNDIPKILLLYLGLMLFLNISFYLWQLCWGKITKYSNQFLRSRAFNNFNDSPSENKMTNTLNFINVNVKQIESQCIDSTIMLIYCIEQTVVSLIYILSINGIAALVFLICGLLPATIPRLTRNWIQNGTKSWNQSYETYNLKVSDAIHGFNTIRHANADAKFKSFIKKALLIEEKKYFFMNFRRNTSNFFAQVSYTLSMVISLAVGSFFVVNGQILVGGLISLFLASDRLTSPIISIVNITNQLNSVSPLLKNINFKIFEGDKILITGKSGIGKSTLFKSLLNELPLIKGKILVDNQLNKSNFLSNFGIVGQDTYIFAESLRFNLTLGKDIPSSQLIKVLKKVKLEYLANKKHLDTPIGEKGLSLSGGEKRKVEIARALLNKKEFLLVDEGLSGLDDDSRKQVFSLLQSLPQTIIEIEHTMSIEDKQKFNQVVNLVAK